MANRLVDIALLDWMPATLRRRDQHSIGESPGLMQGHALRRSPAPSLKLPWVVVLLGVLLAVVALTLARAHPDGSLAGTSAVGALALVGVGLGLVTTGFASWRRWPDSRFGALLAVAGLAWMLPELANPEAGSSIVFTLGLVTFAAVPPVVAHAALAYPGGRVTRASERAALAAAYAGAMGRPGSSTRWCSTRARRAVISAR